MCQDSYESRPPSDAYLQAFLDRGDVIALTTFSETGAVAGGLVAYVLAKFEQERSKVYIYDLAASDEGNLANSRVCACPYAFYQGRQQCGAPGSQPSSQKLPSRSTRCGLAV